MRCNLDKNNEQLSLNEIPLCLPSSVQTWLELTPPQKAPNRPTFPGPQAQRGDHPTLPGPQHRGFPSHTPRAPAQGTLCEGGVGGAAALAEADGGAVVSLPFLGAQGLHGRVGWPEPQERGGHPGGLLAAQHHLLQGRCLSQEFQIPLDGAHVVLRVEAAQRGVLVQGIDFPWDKKDKKPKINEEESATDSDWEHSSPLGQEISSPNCDGFLYHKGTNCCCLPLT